MLLWAACNRPEMAAECDLDQRGYVDNLDTKLSLQINGLAVQFGLQGRAHHPSCGQGKKEGTSIRSEWLPLSLLSELDRRKAQGQRRIAEAPSGYPR